MQYSQFGVENKAPRLLIFPKNRGIEQNKVINFMQAKQQEHKTNSISNQDKPLPSDFFVSLTCLEPKGQALQNPSTQLIKTLIDSYQIIIQQLTHQKQDGLTIYFQNKVNCLLEQQAVQQAIRNGDDKELLTLLDKMQVSTVKTMSVEDKDFESFREHFKQNKSNSLVNYMNMQDKLQQEQVKALQIIEEFDQFEELRQKDIGDQEQKLQDRLKKRTATHKMQQKSPSTDQIEHQ